MLEKSLPKIESSYASIPHNIRAIMGDTSAYQIEFDPPPPPKKTPCMRLESKSRGTKANNNHEDIASDLSLDEGKEEDNYDEEVESDTDSDNNDVPDPGDNIGVVNSEGKTLTGQIMLAWKENHADLLHDFACALFLFLFKNMSSKIMYKLIRMQLNIS